MFLFGIIQIIEIIKKKRKIIFNMGNILKYHYIIFTFNLDKSKGLYGIKTI